MFEKMNLEISHSYEVNLVHNRKQLINATMDSFSMNLSQSTPQSSPEESETNNNSIFGKTTDADEDIIGMINMDIFPSIEETVSNGNLEDFAPNVIMQPLEAIPLETDPNQNFFILGNTANTACGDISSSPGEMSLSDIFLDLMPMQAAETVFLFEQSIDLDLTQNSSMIEELGSQMDANVKTFNTEITSTSQQFPWDGNLALENEFPLASQSCPTTREDFEKLPNIMNAPPDNRQHSDNHHGRNDDVIVPINIMRLLQQKNDKFKDVKEVLESTQPNPNTKGRKVSKTTKVNVMILVLFRAIFLWHGFSTRWRVQVLDYPQGIPNSFPSKFLKKNAMNLIHRKKGARLVHNFTVDVDYHERYFVILQVRRHPSHINIKCQVCDRNADGFHYGADVCTGCRVRRNYT